MSLYKSKQQSKSDGRPVCDETGGGDGPTTSSW